MANALAIDFGAVRQDHGAGHDGGQLRRVARPIVVQQAFHRIGRKMPGGAVGRKAANRICPAEKMLNQCGDIFQAMPQGRNIQSHGREVKIEARVETFLGHCSLWIGGHRRDDSQDDRLVAVVLRLFALLQGIGQFDLGRIRQSLDPVQKERASAAGAPAAATRLPCRSESSLPAAKNFSSNSHSRKAAQATRTSGLFARLLKR